MDRKHNLPDTTTGINNDYEEVASRFLNHLRRDQSAWQTQSQMVFNGEQTRQYDWLGCQVPPPPQVPALESDPDLRSLDVSIAQGYMPEMVDVEPWRADMYGRVLVAPGPSNMVPATDAAADPRYANAYGDNFPGSVTLQAQPVGPGIPQYGQPMQVTGLQDHVTNGGEVFPAQAPQGHVATLTSNTPLTRQVVNITNVTGNERCVFVIGGDSNGLVNQGYSQQLHQLSPSLQPHAQHGPTTFPPLNDGLDRGPVVECLQLDVQQAPYNWREAYAAVSGKHYGNTQRDLVQFAPSEAALGEAEKELTALTERVNSPSAPQALQRSFEDVLPPSPAGQRATTNSEAPHRTPRTTPSERSARRTTPGESPARRAQSTASHRRLEWKDNHTPKDFRPAVRENPKRNMTRNGCVINCTEKYTNPRPKEPKGKNRKRGREAREAASPGSSTLLPDMY